MKYLQYLNYLIKHKWFVMIECFKVKLYWRGIIHDWSKLRLSEFFKYTNYFYGKFPKWNEMLPGLKYHYTGKTEEDIEKEFDYAWLLHQNRNKHHWQYWVLKEDEGRTKILEMPDKYRKEMLADWRGASKAQGYGDNTKKWYLKNREKMQLHPKTRKWIEKQLDL